MGHRRGSIKPSQTMTTHSMKKATSVTSSLCYETTDEESQFTTDFNFIDEDGEVVWIHTKEMALISVPEQLIARERTAEEWDAMTAGVTPVTAPKPVVVPKPKRRNTKPTTRP